MILTSVIYGILIAANEAYGNNLNLLESKSKTENPVVGERAKTLFPFMVFITQERCPIFTGSMLTPKHVLTIAKYVDDINTRPKSFRVQFNNITAFSIKQAFKDDRYNKSDTFCPFNVGIIEVMIDIFRDVSHSIDCDKDVTTEGESVNVKAWNTVNTEYRIQSAYESGINELNFKIMSHSDCARRYHPIPIHITCLEPITKGVLQKVDIGCPVFYHKYVLGIISFVPFRSEIPISNEDLPITMVRITDVSDFVETKKECVNSGKSEVIKILKAGKEHNTRNSMEKLKRRLSNPSNAGRSTKSESTSTE